MKRLQRLLIALGFLATGSLAADAQNAFVFPSGGGAGLAANTFTGVQTLPAGTLANPSLVFTQSNSGFAQRGQPTAAYLNLIQAGSDVAAFSQGEFGLVGNGLLEWGNQTNTFTSSTFDTGLKRNAPGVIQTTTGSNSNFAEFKTRSYVVGGAVPGISGCSAATQTGGGTAGTFTLGAVSCSVTLTFAFTAPTGWSCFANDRTTAAAAGLVHVTASTTTTAVIAVPASAVISDVVDFHCMAY